MAAGCVPIYWGDPEISKVFNPKAMINVSDFPSFAALLDVVQKVDSNDSLWQQLHEAPALNDVQYAKEHYYATFKEWIRHIISQPITDAQRRNRLMWGRMYVEDRIRQTQSLEFRLRKAYHRYVWKIKTQYFRGK